MKLNDLFRLFIEWTLRTLRFLILLDIIVFSLYLIGFSIPNPNIPQSNNIQLIGIIFTGNLVLMIYDKLIKVITKERIK